MQPSHDAMSQALIPTLGCVAQGARASALVCGGTALARQKIAELLHAAGRTAGEPFLPLHERWGLRRVLLRLLRSGMESLAPVTLYVDGVERLDPDARVLLLHVLQNAEDHWNQLPGRRDGVRVIAGARMPARLDPALARALSAVRIDADEAPASAALRAS